MRLLLLLSALLTALVGLGAVACPAVARSYHTTTSIDAATSHSIAVAPAQRPAFVSAKLADVVAPMALPADRLPARFTPPYATRLRV